ncbi:MAG TPA: ABC transporter ATP-binding protein [Hyphomicrobiales bacterium]|nr:ABC transporter ATP-binding protein [Hyphomicrobiales bacterium]
MAPALLEVTDLHAEFRNRDGGAPLSAVDGVSFDLHQGETLGVVGESGSGKTTIAHSIIRMLPPGGRIAGGSIRFDGVELTTLPARDMRRLRGAEVAMILQDPMASLDPMFTIFDQVAEPARYHRGLRGRALVGEVADLLRQVRIPSPKQRMRDYPHQMSGGQRQRVVGAAALAGRPKLIIADEPTTSLDVTVQRQYLDLLKTLQRETGVALIFITHDLGIVAKVCDRVAVMYAGRMVEQRPVERLFHDPRHPYTQALLRAMPKLGSAEPLFAIPGQAPNLAALPRGCSFQSRCPQAGAPCLAERPPTVALGLRQEVQCHFAEGAPS